MRDQLRRSQWQRWLPWFLCAAALAFWFPRAGRLLVVQDQFASVDLALVLSGSSVSRTLAARDLYLQDRIGRILIIPEPKDPTEDELAKLGLVNPALPPMSQRLLVASGVPAERIAFLPEPVDGTIREARRVRRFLMDRMPKSLVIITSQFASRRACVAFRHIFRQDRLQISCYATPYDPFVPERWWSSPRNALYVLMEYPKFLVNGLQLALGREGG